MQIGLISDTHSYLDPNVFKAFSECDEIWHAGDFGTLEIAQQLGEFKPFRGVYGNIDEEDVREVYPLDLRFECEGVDVWMTHIAGHPGRYDKRVKRILGQSQPPKLLICGHSHLLRVDSDTRHGGMMCVNPGAAGHHGFHQIRTMLKFELSQGEVQNMRVVELGPRGRKNQAR